MEQILNFIGNEFQPPRNGSYLDNFDPSTGAIYAQIADSDADDLLLAVKSAKQALPSWQQTSAECRADIMEKIAQLILQNVDALALAESIDNGKPLQVAKNIDIPRAAKNFCFFAQAITQFSSEAYDTQKDVLNFVWRQPIGIVACISPWNLPLYLFTWKIAPAIAAGNCVIAKPSELTPKTALLLADICRQAGLPAGVLSILNGLGSKIGQEIVSHPEIKAISFTGGTKTGREIAKIAGPAFKKMSLELGGKNPIIVFADADLKTVVPEIVRASFSNQGQICLCGSRLLVHQDIYSTFKTEFISAVKALKIGDPLLPDTDLGALVSLGHMEKVLSYIDLAKLEGGTILVGGQRYFVAGRCREGWFVEPTVVEGLGPNCRTNQEEIFGPVVTLASFSSDNEAINLANSSIYGLAASIWTKDMARIMRFSKDLECGIVWANSWMLRDLRTPFGGWKDSGLGREGGLEALRFFTEAKTVCIKF